MTGLNLFSQVPFDKALRLGTANGIENNWVTTVEEDADGIAWFGTIQGLYNWDGIRVESFFPDDEDNTTISSLHIIDVMPDIMNNKVWVATEAGLSVYNTKKKSFTNYSNDPDNSNYIPSRNVKRIFKDASGDIWIGLNRAGLLRYSSENKEFEEYLCDTDNIDPDDGLCSVSVIDMQDDIDNDSIMWLGTTRGLIRFNKIDKSYDKYIFEQEDDGLRSQYNSIRFLTAHPNGKIYYAIWWYGLCSFDRVTKEFQRIEPHYKEGTANFGRDLINGFHHESAQRFWINSNKGMQLYDIPSNSIVKEYKNTDKNWYSIDHVDSNGRIWSATHNKGLYIFNPILQQYRISYYEEFDIYFPSYTRKLLLDSIENKLYVASEYSKGLYIQDLKTKNWERIDPPDDFDLKKMGGFRASDLVMLEPNKILIVESSGLFIYEPGDSSLKKFKHQPDKNYGILSKVVKDKQGVLWISSYKGSVYSYDPKTDEFYNYIDEIKNISQTENNYTHICEDPNGNIWVNSNNRILIYDRINDRFLLHDKKVNGKFQSGSEQLSPDAKGRIWLGTNNHKFAYGHMDSLDQGICRYIGKENGLKGKNVYMVYPHNEKLLVFTDNFVQVFDPETMEFERNIDKSYMPSPIIQFTPEKLGDSLIMGSIRGVSFIDFDNLKLNEERPRPYIKSMHAFDELIPVKARYGVVDSIYLSYTQNFFSFEFSAINFNIPELTSFKYMLEGYDEEWIDGTERKFAAYTKVPGGEYRFLVKAYNNEGLESETTSTTYLNISTIWWKTSWFISMSSVLLFSLLMFIYNFRIAQVRRDEQLKREYERKLADVELSALRAQMNPHFIFNSLNSIEYYIISNDPVKASDYLNRFSRLIRLILQNSKSTIVPLKDDIEALKLYIELESMRFDKSFEYEVKLEKGIDTEKINVPPMLLQPYVENSIWHGLLQKQGELGKIEITISKLNDAIKCVIEDNGIGRKAAQKLKSKTATKKKSYGMKITSDRLQMLNNLAGTKASVNVIDLYDSDQKPLGTRVELIIPI